VKTKALTATQINTLAQRLSDTPIIPATSAKKAGDAFARNLAARVGDERAADLAPHLGADRDVL
jgi:RNase P protein component